MEAVLLGPIWVVNSVDFHWVSVSIICTAFNVPKSTKEKLTAVWSSYLRGTHALVVQEAN